MSGGLDVLSLREDDVKKFLTCGAHLGATNMDFQMEQYVYKRKTDGMICVKSDSQPSVYVNMQDTDTRLPGHQHKGVNFPEI